MLILIYVVIKYIYFFVYYVFFKKEGLEEIDKVLKLFLCM